MNPEFPIYIPSKGRHESRITVRYLEAMRVPFSIIVEEPQYRDYASVIAPENILVLDAAYQRRYDTCDDLGDTRSKGSGPARNFAWDHAQAKGAAWHWVVDDNIQGFFRLNNNLKVPVSDGTIFRCMEDFAGRYSNVAMAGPNYFMFASRKTAMPPYVLNTRIFSCNLIRTDLPFRWRARYNEDAYLSLRMLKAGLCTVQFNAFLQYKLPTQTVAGGNTTEVYGRGTYAKSMMLTALHPDVCKPVWKFKRHHHSIDFSRFKGNKLIRREGVSVASEPNNYGMSLKERTEAERKAVAWKRHKAKPIPNRGAAPARLSYIHMQGGQVPGGHFVISDGVRKPFITPMRECNSIALRHSDIVVDIGAYVGTYAIRAARYPVRRVVAYEPTPFSHEILALTKLPNLELHRAAVAAEAGELEFYTSRGIGVTNSLVPSSAKDISRVAAVAYQQAVAEATVVKIDIEGGEYDLPIIQPNLRAVILDFHKLKGRDWRAEAERIIAELDAAGFRAVIKPDWSNGWTLAGSWLRDRPDPGGGCDLLMSGALCCGCGVAIEPGNGKAMCDACVKAWLPRHRAGYRVARRLQVAA